MGIKFIMISCMLTSFLLSLLFCPTFLLKNISQFHSTDHPNSPPQRKSYPVTFAYLISASKGDVGKLKRLLTALYHPGNYYLIHLDLEASPQERTELENFLAKHQVFKQLGNVQMVEKSNLVTYRGPTMLSTTLHAMAMLLKCCKWDWFINLSASDYPLITQDDLIVAFSTLPRDLNFIQHTSQLGWKLKMRAKPVIIDPGLYRHNKSEIIWSATQRGLPTAFKLYTGSAWTMLSRSFAEYCIVGWDNLPRILLLYYTNFISTPEGYFQTVICNSKQYQNTTVNHDMHYIMWDNPPKQHPLSLGVKDYRKMILSSVPFARKFKQGDPVLDKIDRELLKRRKEQFSYGGWCLDDRGNGCFGLSSNSSFYSRENDDAATSSGAGARRLQALLRKSLLPRNFRKQQCR